jgi:hypothetical protein
MKNLFFLLAISLFNCATTKDSNTGFTYIKDFNKSHIPIFFELDDSLKEEMFESILERAEIFYQNYLPNNTFFDKKSVNVIPIINVDNNDILYNHFISTGLYGLTVIDKKDGVLQPVAIYISAKRLRLLSFSLKWRLFAHEMGHCLGLTHDKLMGSIMFPKLIRLNHSLYPGYTTEIPYLSEEDKQFLMEKYQ